MSRKSKVIPEALKQAYRDASENAADMERSGNYARAVELWKIAETQALNITQREWCKTRRLYCSKWQRKREKMQ